MKYKLVSGLALTTSLFAVGCGGSGLGSASMDTGGSLAAPTAAGSRSASATLGAYVTSTANPQFAHFWVRVFSVSAVSATGSTPLFTSNSGNVIDLVTLVDNKGQRFDFLGKAPVANQSFSSLKLQLSRTVSVVPVGQKKASSKLLSATLTDAANASASDISIALNPPVSPATKQNLVIDFNLKAWSLDAGGNFVPAVQRGNDLTIGNKDRDNAEDFEGNVSALAGTAPAISFTLGTLAVTTDANTIIFNANGAANPALANGERVEVTGPVVNGTIAATQIKIENVQAAQNLAEVVGTVSALNAGAGTITLTVVRADHFVPTSATVNVVVTASTKFLLEKGGAVAEADFFAALASAPANTTIEADGTFDGTNFNATFIKAETEGPDDHGHHGGGSGGGGSDDGGGHH
jgi:hypothetical protein